MLKWLDRMKCGSYMGKLKKSGQSELWEGKTVRFRIQRLVLLVVSTLFLSFSYNRIHHATEVSNSKNTEKTTCYETTSGTRTWNLRVFSNGNAADFKSGGCLFESRLGNTACPLLPISPFHCENARKSWNNIKSLPTLHLWITCSYMTSGQPWRCTLCPAAPTPCSTSSKTAASGFPASSECVRNSYPGALLA
jgi:hypothetical protein